MNTIAHAHPCWADLSTTDVDAAEAFYRDLLGWTVARVETPVGEMFDLISEEPQPGPYFSMDVGAVSWFELMSHATAEATRFYGEVFRWTAVTDAAEQNEGQPT